MALKFVQPPSVSKLDAAGFVQDYGRRSATHSRLDSPIPRNHFEGTAPYGYACKPTRNGRQASRANAAEDFLGAGFGNRGINAKQRNASLQGQAWEPRPPCIDVGSAAQKPNRLLVDSQARLPRIVPSGLDQSPPPRARVSRNVRPRGGDLQFSSRQAVAGWRDKKSLLGSLRGERSLHRQAGKTQAQATNGFRSYLAEVEQSPRITCLGHSKGAGLTVAVMAWNGKSAHHMAQISGKKFGAGFNSSEAAGPRIAAGDACNPT